MDSCTCRYPIQCFRPYRRPFQDNPPGVSGDVPSPLVWRCPSCWLLSGLSESLELVNQCGEVEEQSQLSSLAPLTACSHYSFHMYLIFVSGWQTVFISLWGPEWNPQSKMLHEGDLRQLKPASQMFTMLFELEFGCRPWCSSKPTMCQHVT